MLLTANKLKLLHDKTLAANTVVIQLLPRFSARCQNSRVQGMCDYIRISLPSDLPRYDVQLRFRKPLTISFSFSRTQVFLGDSLRYVYKHRQSKFLVSDLTTAVGLLIRYSQWQANNCTLLKSLLYGWFGGISWFHNVSKAELEYSSVLDSHNSFVIFIGTIIFLFILFFC